METIDDDDTTITNSLHFISELYWIVSAKMWVSIETGEKFVFPWI